jgi:DNA-binding MarR family transcriptional regulator
LSSKRRDAEHEFLTDDEFRAWHGSVRFVTAATRAIDEALVAAHGISINEFDVLITLYNAPERRLRMTELAQRVLLTPSGLSHLVTRLEGKGLIARVVDPDDRRSFFAKLTRAGDAQLRRSRLTHNDVIRAQLTERLRPDQLRALGDVWDAVHDEPA